MDWFANIMQTEVDVCLRSCVYLTVAPPVIGHLIESTWCGAPDSERASGDGATGSDWFDSGQTDGARIAPKSSISLGR